MCHEDCRIDGIPERLHGKDREILPVSNADRLFLWFAPKAGSEGEFDLSGVQCCNQSANSELLNEKGSPADVTYDMQAGGLKPGRRVACFSVSDLRSLSFPNEFARVNIGGREVPVLDEYSFDVEHIPTGCMYPHCEIKTIYQGEKKAKINNGHFRAVIRSEFKKLADRFSEEMGIINESLA